MAKGKATTECSICHREVARRYMCHNCQTISFESNQPPRGKRKPLIQYSKSDVFECSGCSSKVSNEKLVFHHCLNFGIDFLTARLDCLFCHRQTDESFNLATNGVHSATKQPIESSILPVECPNKLCRNLIPADSVFCQFCGKSLKRCTDSKCGQPVHPDSIFCPYCGTSVMGAKNQFRKPSEPSSKI